MIDRNRFFKDFLWLVALAGALAMIFRLWYGLGPTTHLTDAVPWGLWKILNMVAGVALATGGFTIGFLVYVLRMERLRPLVKPAILVAFLGYGSSCFALMLDIGLPHRIWHPILMWNGRSFLFEVAWCVMLYFTVTMVELSPTVLERVRLTRAATFLHRIAPGVVLVGIALSSLHHSSLGSLFLVTPQRLHALWFSEWIPVHFILSAMGAGMMGIVLVKILYARSYDPASIFGPRSASESGSEPALCAAGERETTESPTSGPDFPMVRQLATIAAGVLGTYLVIKIVDLVASGAWRHLLAGSWESWFYALELTVAALIPVLLVALPRTRRSPAGLAAAASCAVAGLLWNRLDVGILGYFRDAGTVYMPSLAEWAVSLGVVAAAILVFVYAVENLPIFDTMWRGRREARRRFVPAFDRVSRVWFSAFGKRLDRVSLIAIFGLALAWVLMYPPQRSDFRRPGAEARPPLALDAERAVLRLDANRTALATDFPHRDHQQRLGKKSSCGQCHHLSAPTDHATPCSRCHRDTERTTDIFRHGAHLVAVAEHEGLTGLHPGNQSCAQCHTPGRTMNIYSAKSCLSCHGTDMAPSRPSATPFAMRWASGYRVAMHETCIGCHEKERERTERPELADCSTCHQGLRYREPTPLERETVARRGRLPLETAAGSRDVAILATAN